MAKEPWRSSAGESSNPPVVKLDVMQARESPCLTCSGAPCCTFLPLFEFRVNHMRQLDHAIYLLNFDRIELGLSASGSWSVYYRYPCRFLDRDSFRCSLHATPEQPRICVHYNPFSCWYKKALTRGGTEEFLRIDRARIAFIVDRVKLDEDRNLVEVPAWDLLVSELARLPSEPEAQDDGEPGADPIFDAWKQEVLARPTEPPPRRLRVWSRPTEAPPRNLRAWSELADPCDGCGAPCCTTLTFPHSPPTSYANMDYIKFALGFPGIEVGVSERGWSLIVKTRCRHLDGNRCGVYGKPERPLMCKYYDANRCDYKPQFGVPRPEGYVRVRLEQFPALVAGFAFDDTGLVRRFPTTDEIRARIEDGWRKAAREGAR
jgi:Fe-S-cluster containining protein